MKKCIIISGAPENDLSYYSPLINSGFIIAADSGYKKCLKLGILPDLIIGDFDSSERPDNFCEIIELPKKKDDTDTFYCVKEAIGRGFDNLIILGAVGGRFDHTYSNVLCLDYCSKNNIAAEIISHNNKITLINSAVVINNSKYKYFSLFAFGEKCEGLNIIGAKYGLNDYTLELFDPLCQSNECLNDKTEIKFKNGKLILIQSND